MSPIRPENVGRYPADWSAITARIRARAKDTCECTGECGHDHMPAGRCGAPNRTLIRRDPDDLGRWWMHIHSTACLGEQCDAVQVVLTVAHLDRVPENCDATNLRALCQRCHLRYDREEHRTNAAATRQRKADEASGQIGLFTTGGTHGSPAAKAVASSRSRGGEASSRPRDT